MPDKRVILVLVPPGKRRDFHKFLQEKLKGSLVLDIESKLCQDLGVVNMHEALSRFTRNFLQEKWRDVISYYAERIHDGSSNVNIIVGHAVYYANVRREFYSVFDASHISKLVNQKMPPVTHTLLVIDDIYDIYTELSKGSKELFGDSTFSAFIENYIKGMEIKQPQAKLGSKIYLNWLQYCMNSILNWRSQEIILCQNIAFQIGSKFMVWGLKQDPDSLIKWFSDEQNKIFYISHPISEPRRELKSGKWPNIVYLINNFHKILLNYDICSVMPTAIDEFRFGKDKKHHYTSKLTPRWPISSDLRKTLRHYNLLGTDINKTHLFVPYSVEYDGRKIKKHKEKSLKVIQDYINGTLNSLEMNIMEQLANRDHLLVWLNDGIIVLEPWSIKDVRIHGGVRKELQYLREVNLSIMEASQHGKGDLETRKPKKLVVIFSDAAVEKIAKLQELRSQVLDKLRRIISENYNINENDVRSLVNERFELNLSGGSLGTVVATAQVSKIRENLPELKKIALREAFLAETISMKEGDAPLLILILDNLKILFKKETIEKIKNFLISGVVDDAWESKLIKSVEAAGLKVK